MTATALDGILERSREAAADRRRRIMGLTDSALVGDVYRFVEERVDDDERDDLYAYLEEVFERFAPHAAWENAIEDYAEGFTTDDRAHHLEGCREYMSERAAERVMARFTFEATL